MKKHQLALTEKKVTFLLQNQPRFIFSKRLFEAQNVSNLNGGTAFVTTLPFPSSSNLRNASARDSDV
jgi:hypothetical protein